jgi:hypothetical protein
LCLGISPPGDRGDVALTLINAVRVALGTNAGSRAKQPPAHRSGCTPRLPAEVSGKPICLPSCPGDHGPDHPHQPRLTAVAPTNAEEVSSCFLGSVGTSGSTSTTCNSRGPCTPSTRLSSMSLVALCPEIQFCVRDGSSRARVRTRRPFSPTTGYPVECPCRSPAYQAAGQRSARTSAKSGRAWHAHDRTICWDCAGVQITAAQQAVDRLRGRP